jgi:predicted dehydrogenase
MMDMKIQFKNKVFEMPIPVQSESEVIVKVEKYAFVPLPQKIKTNRSLIQNAYAKLIFFLIREGIKLTLNKIRARFLQQKINLERQVIFVYGQVKHANSFVIALGPQDCPYSEYLSFPKALTLNVDRQRDIQNDFKIILEYFGNKRESLEALYNYSPYSGKELLLKLESILEYNTKGQVGTITAENNLKTLEISSGRAFSKRKRSLSNKKNEYDLFLAGAGTYARSYILTNLRNVNYHTIIDFNPILASVMGEEYGFRYRDTSSQRALLKLKESDNPILLIATYHSTHLPIVEYALSINSNTKIFIEKPPVTSADQLKRLIALRDNPTHFVEIGYNRRHSPFIIQAKDIIKNFNGPITMTCIVKELNIPSSHWYYWPNQETRITGNMSHWIDLGIFFIQSSPVSITAISASKQFPGDESTVVVLFEDGSLLTLIASDRGNRLRGVQEYIDIRCADLTITIDDFLKMKVQNSGHQKIYRKITRDKGHKRMYEDFIYDIQNGNNAKYPNKDLCLSTTLYLSISSMLLSNIRYREISLNDYEKACKNLKNEEIQLIEG